MHNTTQNVAACKSIRISLLFAHQLVQYTVQYTIIVTAQGKQEIWMVLSPDREKTGKYSK